MFFEAPSHNSEPEHEKEVLDVRAMEASEEEADLHGEHVDLPKKEEDSKSDRDLQNDGLM